MCAKLLQLCLTLFDPMDCSLPWHSPSKNTGVGCHAPPSGDLPDAGIEPTSLASPSLAGRFFTTSTTWEAPYIYVTLQFMLYIIYRT